MWWLWIVAALAEPWERQVVIEHDGVDAEQGYKRAREWAVSAFTESRSVLEVERPGELLLGKMNIGAPARSIVNSNFVNGRIQCMLRVEFKDNRSRLTIDACVHISTMYGPNGWGPITTDEHPTPEQCRNIQPIGNCTSKYHQNEHAHLRGLVVSTADTAQAGLTAALQAPVEDAPEDAW
jgi:hypothetical protein